MCEQGIVCPEFPSPDLQPTAQGSTTLLATRKLDARTHRRLITFFHFGCGVSAICLACWLWLQMNAEQERHYLADQIRFLFFGDKVWDVAIIGGEIETFFHPLLLDRPLRKCGNTTDRRRLWTNTGRSELSSKPPSRISKTRWYLSTLLPLSSYGHILSARSLSLSSSRTSFTNALKSENRIPVALKHLIWRDPSSFSYPGSLRTAYQIEAKTFFSPSNGHPLILYESPSSPKRGVYRGSAQQHHFSTTSVLLGPTFSIWIMWTVFYCLIQP